MSISLSCPECGDRLKLKEKYAGRKIKCSSCSEAIRVPELESPGEPEVQEDKAPRRRKSKGLASGSRSVTKKGGKPGSGAKAEPRKRKRNGSARRKRSAPGRSKEWKWRYSRWTGVMFGPIPVGIIVVFIGSVIYAMAGGK